jgi:hypothetical protein
VELAAALCDPLGALDEDEDDDDSEAPVEDDVSLVSPEPVEVSSEPVDDCELESELEVPDALWESEDDPVDVAVLDALLDVAAPPVEVDELDIEASEPDCAEPVEVDTD